MTDFQARDLLIEELRSRDGDGVNMHLCIAYVGKNPEGDAASVHDKRKLDAALAAIRRAGN